MKCCLCLFVSCLPLLVSRALHCQPFVESHLSQAEILSQIIQPAFTQPNLD